MKPHKHAELIKAWADGAEIEYRWAYDTSSCPVWSKWIEFDGKTNTFVENEYFEYRIKPEPKPDVVLYANCSKCLPHIKNQFYADLTFAYSSLPTNDNPANLKLTFDGETGELKSAEVLK